VFTYPLTIQLVRLRLPAGAFQFGITGPPGVYFVSTSTNLPEFNKLRDVTNALGAVTFTDTTAHFSPNKFYTAFLQSPPDDMVFIPPITFIMGSPPTEQDRDPNEGTQTVVTLTRGFWIGKHEVTQGEYLSIMHTNPSDFPGDLSRPVSSVSWLDATNYCAQLTERELAAGRIPAGSRYRLPTEAEWECAARAGTSTRFSYGDDPQYLSLTNYAWAPVSATFELAVHPVGRKLPNPWGLYDMYGNVFEWCQDWLGPLPGGSVTDPQGPASNPMGWKVMRGGAFDFGFSACRSASRSFRFPLFPDSDVGFRVVLAAGPQ
jgi:formylglycine-generating enzyme required for sulfatase activity